MDKMTAHEIDFGLIQWGADYVDPTNFFDWWQTGNRHTWQNEEFNRLIDEARGLIDTERRCQIYNEAEKILVSDVGGVFVVFPVIGSLYKSYLGNLPVSNVGGPGQMSQTVVPSIYIKTGLQIGPEMPT
jgi:ABC-type transport system substrate-binding protein